MKALDAIFLVICYFPLVTNYTQLTDNAGMRVQKSFKCLFSLTAILLKDFTIKFRQSILSLNLSQNDLKISSSYLQACLDTSPSDDFDAIYSNVSSMSGLFGKYYILLLSVCRLAERINRINPKELPTVVIIYLNLSRQLASSSKVPSFFT